MSKTAERPFIFGIEGTRLTDAERELFSSAPPFGVILFLRNVTNPEQLHALIADIQATTQGASLVFVDQEGGRVQRLIEPHWTQFPSVSHYRDLDDAAFEKAIYAHYRLLGSEIVQAGFDANCAPCLDLLCDDTASFLEERCFDPKSERVISGGRAAIKGLHDAGILTVIKHIPGHGRASLDSHLSLPKIMFETDPYADVPPADIQVFQADYGVKMGMSSHILYPQIDPENPLTLSRKGIDFVREKIEFNGILLSDDIGMKALSGSVVEITNRAFDAGIDVILECSGEIENIRSLYDTQFGMDANLINMHGELLEFRSQNVQPLTHDQESELRAVIGLS